MFSAQWLPGGITAYSQWFPRGGDYLRASVEVAARKNSDLTVRVFTKNREDTGNGADADAAVTLALTGVGKDTDEWGPNKLKELVRYQYTTTGTAANGVLMRMLPAIWYDAVV